MLSYTHYTSDLIGLDDGWYIKEWGRILIHSGGMNDSRNEMIQMNSDAL